MIDPLSADAKPQADELIELGGLAQHIIQPLLDSCGQKLLIPELMMKHKHHIHSHMNPAQKNIWCIALNMCGAKKTAESFEGVVQKLKSELSGLVQIAEL